MISKIKYGSPKGRKIATGSRLYLWQGQSYTSLFLMFKKQDLTLIC